MTDDLHHTQQSSESERQSERQRVKYIYRERDKENKSRGSERQRGRGGERESTRAVNDAKPTDHWFLNGIAMAGDLHEIDEEVKIQEEHRR